MESVAQIQLSSAFVWKKWTVITSSVLINMATVILATILIIETESQTEWLALVLIIANIIIVFELSALIGAYNEHYWMTLANAVFMVVLAFCSTLTLIPYLMAVTILALIISGLNFSYAKDLKKIRRFQSNCRMAAVINGQTNTQTHWMLSGCSHSGVNPENIDSPIVTTNSDQIYVIGSQNGGHFGQPYLWEIPLSPPPPSAPADCIPPPYSTLDKSQY